MGWHMGLILRHTEVHWKEKEAHGRYLEMALISVILRVTEHFISEFCEKNVVYSVNSRRGRGQEIIFSGKKQNYQRTGGSCCDR